MSKELGNLMVLGASSNAGKSLLVTALCRWFRQQNYSVNPFKSQNMSLNAIVTPEGHEIGIAQHAQALAAGQIPSHLHNPILLKPQGGHVSQIIARGLVRDRLSAKEYYAQKDKYATMATQSFDQLNNQSDIVVLEGAGSPVELNLMDRDIANLFMARHAKAKIILVVNIEMGGFFASTYGTVELLPPEDRANVIGVVVNNFRGDPSLFKEDLGKFEEKIGVPILGVLPHIENLALDVEDSVSLNKFTPPSEESKYQVRIVRLPHIANFNEFQVFEHCPEISWAFTESPQDIAEADVVILPGTKTTLADLQWLKDKGFEAPLRKHAEAGKKLIGICGGFQILGGLINDPHGLEDSEHREAQGLGYFDMTTTFGGNKELHSVNCFLEEQSTLLKAFELHMGSGQPSQGDSWINVDGQTKGWKLDNIYGSYLHGLFENKEVLKNIFPNTPCSDMHELRETTFNQLSQAIQENLDLSKVLDKIALKSQGNS